MMRRFLVVLFILCPISLSAQEVGFMGINVGMTREQVLEKAGGNQMIEVPKNRDVDFFPVEERKILTLSIKPEVPFIYLQFFDELLYAITVIFDEKYLDFFTLNDVMEQKYGRYTQLTPDWRQWQLDSVTIKVEKPAVVKYIALEEFLEATAFRGENEGEDRRRKNLLLQGL
jgi:hypothetical protein